MSTTDNPDGTFTLHYDAVPDNTAKAMDPRYGMVCMEHGHVPLETPGDEGPANVGIHHTHTGLLFGLTLFCTRCCAVYWEPVPPASPKPEKT